jgi:hypothetical protein
MKRSRGSPDRFDDPDRVADAIINRVGKNLVLALPLGLGKANHVVNALFARASNDSSIRLHIFTALTLEAPRAAPGLRRLSGAHLWRGAASGHTCTQHHGR